MPRNEQAAYTADSSGRGFERVRGALKEAVFSSSEDRIRATPANIAIAGPSIASGGIGSAYDPSWLRRTAESLFSVLLPSDCRICGLPLLNISRLPVCPECLASIEPIRRRVCSICGERVLSSYAVCDDDGLRRCPVCRTVDRPFERAVAYGSYEGGLRELVHLLKSHGVKPAANVLGRMLGEAIGKLDLGEKVLVIPVPLYRGKRSQRGFNQAEMIAQAAIKASPARERLQLAPNILLRTRDTHSQIGLTSYQRRENLRGAFSVARATEVTGREVLLVDDVYTTGTTASERARVLRRVGVAKVVVATVARTLKLASNRQGFKVSRFQGFQGFKVSRFQGFKVTRLQGFKVSTKKQNLLNSWSQSTLKP